MSAGFRGLLELLGLWPSAPAAGATPGAATTAHRPKGYARIGDRPKGLATVAHRPKGIARSTDGRG